MDFRSVVIAALLQVPLFCMVSTCSHSRVFPSLSCLVSTVISTEARDIAIIITTVGANSK